MSFQYVLIPAADSEPITARTASKDGGLTNDALSKNAKAYFSERSGGSQRAALLARATPEEQKQIADKIRATYASRNDESSKQVAALSDQQIVDLLKVQEGQASCEISCLTIPTPLNGHTAVSMYGDDSARTKNHPFNRRATELMIACGHAFPEDDGVVGDGKPNGIYGDVFVGRAIDDEAKDVWERADLTPSEVEGDPGKQPWCKMARRKGGGGGRGGAAASLSKTLQNFQQQQQSAGGGQSAAAAAAAPTTENGNGNGSSNGNYSWTQTDDEVELKFVVPKETKAKNVAVKFGHRSLRVSLTGVEDGGSNSTKVLCEGATWDQIDVDGSTFTLQNENGQRELCVSLEKMHGGQTWNDAIEEES
eukprot:jgi/Psemu1/289982/fgenesh1_pg.433_\